MKLRNEANSLFEFFSSAGLNYIDLTLNKEQQLKSLNISQAQRVEADYLFFFFINSTRDFDKYIMVNIEKIHLIIPYTMSLGCVWTC